MRSARYVSSSRQINFQRLAKIARYAAIDSVYDNIHGTAVGESKRHTAFGFDGLNLLGFELQGSCGLAVDHGFDVDVV